MPDDLDVIELADRLFTGELPIESHHPFASSGQLAEVQPGAVFVDAFANSAAVDTDDGLVVDTSGFLHARGVHETIRGWTASRLHTAVFLDDIAHAVRVPDHLLTRPYLQPIYDEPEFVVRNIWRLYGGWYDGDPSHLKPAPTAALAAELASLAGGAGRLADRAREVAAAGDLRLAGHLAELAAQAAPDDKGVHAVHAEVFGARAKEEASTMSKGIFSWAEHESSERLAR